MEVADVVGSVLDRAQEVLVDELECLLDLLLGHLEGTELHMVELGRVVAQGLVSPLADLLDDVDGNLHRLRVKGAVALEHRGLEDLAFLQVNTSHCCTPLSS